MGIVRAGIATAFLAYALIGTANAASVPAAGSLSGATKLSIPTAVGLANLQKDPYVIAGYLNVKLYGAVGDGHHDDTAAFQNALNAASQDSNGDAGATMAVFVPAGVYRVTSTITGYQIVGATQFSVYNHKYGTTNNYNSGVLAPILVGDPTNRPTIVLDDKVFTNPESPQPILHFVNTPNAGKYGCGGQWGGSAPIGCFDILFNSVIRDINVKTGNNAGAIGIQFYSAQFSYMQNVTVDATNGYAGIQGTPATELWTNIAVTGGQYGIIINGTAGTNSVAGLTLQGQTVAGLQVGPHLIGDVSITGFNIKETVPGATGIIANSGMSQGTTVALVDGSISVAGTQPAISNSGNDSLYLNNVYLQAPSAAKLIINGTASIPSTGGVQLVSEYGHADPSNTPPVTSTNNHNPGYALANYIILNDAKQQADYGPVYGSGSVPSDLVLRHIPAKMPWAFDANTAWVTDYGADPTGNVDATSSIQNAINAAHSAGSDEVFLPRGLYNITSTLKLFPNTKFFGPPGNLATLAAPNWVTGHKISPFVQVGDAVGNPSGSFNGTAVVSDLHFVLPTTGSASQITDQTYLTALEWQTGMNSILNQIEINFVWTSGSATSPATRNLIQVDSNGGGRFFGAQIAGDDGANNGGYMFYVTNNSPVTLYGSNLEHGAGSAFYGFNNASNVRLVGLKTESGSAQNLISLTNAKNILVSGVNGDGLGHIVTHGSSNVNFNALAYYEKDMASGAMGSYIIDDAASYTTEDAYALFKLGNFNNAAFPTCSNGLNCTGTSTSTASPSPIASFSCTPVSGVAPLAVTCKDSSTNSPTSWSWNFGDGSTSTSQNPSHTFTTTGSYTVALTATNSEGSNTLTQSGYVTVGSVTTNNSCTLSGQTIANGASVTAWLAASVPSGQTCQSQVRTCSDGTLSGSYTYPSCSVVSSGTPSGTAVITPNAVTAGQTITVTAALNPQLTATGTMPILWYYNSAGTVVGRSGWTGVNFTAGVPTTLTTTFNVPATAANGTYSVSATIYSSNGANARALAGIPTFASFVVGAVQPCSFNGTSLASGTSVTAYLASMVSAPQTCESQTRQCVNGVLSGTYTYASCVALKSSATFTVTPNPAIAGQPINVSVILNPALTANDAKLTLWLYNNQTGAYAGEASVTGLNFTSGQTTTTTVALPSTLPAGVYNLNPSLYTSAGASLWGVTNAATFTVDSYTVTPNPAAAGQAINVYTTINPGVTVDNARLTLWLYNAETFAAAGEASATALNYVAGQMTQATVTLPTNLPAGTYFYNPSIYTSTGTGVWGATKVETFTIN